MELKFDSGFQVIVEYLSQVGSILRVNLIDFQYRIILTQIFSNYLESRVEFYFHLWLNILGQNDSIFFFQRWIWDRVSPFGSHQQNQKDFFCYLEQPKSWMRLIFVRKQDSCCISCGICWLYATVKYSVKAMLFENDKRTLTNPKSWFHLL